LTGRGGSVPPKVIGINARQVSVSHVLVNGAKSTFKFVAIQDFLVPEGQKELRELATLEAYRTKAFQESQQAGELQIDVADGTVFPISLQVFFSVSDPSGGVVFRWPKGDEKAPHMYLQGRMGEACCVFPCLDNPGARCVFEVIVTTDAALSVVASGVMDPFPKYDGVLSTRSFRTSASCAARDIFVAVGPFESYIDPRLPSVTHYCMPGKHALLVQTVSCAPDIVKFFESSLGLPAMPMGSFSTLWLADVMSMSSSFHCGALFSDYLLFPRPVIDMLTETTYEIAVAVAEQWVNAFLQVDEWSEMWLIQGMSHLLAHLFMTNFEKPNNARWRLLNLTDEFLNMPPDIVARPLYIKEPGHAADLFLPFVHKKALLVLSMVQRRVNETMFKEVLKALFAQPAVYSTHSFLDKVAHASHHVMDDIEASWVRRGGYLSISCGFSWNQKRHYLEFALKQDFNISRFTGLLPVRVHELDGPFMHEIVLSDAKPYAWDDFPVHARPPQKKKKRAKKSDAAEQVAETHGTATAAAPGTDPKAALKFQAADGQGEEKEICPIVFLRVDPDGQWIMKAVFHQPEEMWMNQLDTSLDIVAEREAVRGLSAFKSESAINRLAEIVNDPGKFWGVRVEAVASLAALSGQETDWKAAVALVASYKEAFYRPDAAVPKQNDFSDLSQYLVNKAMLTALAGIFDSQCNSTYLKGAMIILEVLQHNDNSLNIYSDYSFLRTALEAAGRLHLPPGSQELGLLNAQIDRYSKLADVLPCYHMELKVAVLNCRTTRIVDHPGTAACGPGELQYFRKHLFNVNYPWNVRAAAGDGLFRSVLNRCSPEEAEGVLLELVNVAENTKEMPVLRLKILENAAVAVRAHKQAMQWTSADVAGEHERLFSGPNHIKLADKIWVLVSGPAFAFCQLLRGAATQLYSALWGLDTPPQYGPPPAHLVLANKSVVLEDAPTSAMVQNSRDQPSNWREVVGQGGEKPVVKAKPKVVKLKVPIVPAAAAPAENTTAEPEQKRVKFEDE
jgi:transcription initiation factor TFIID subunit 2